jgi:hypothetical protein
MGERANNAQLARELNIALPAEFTQEQNISLARDYVKRTFVDAGMCADLCVHDTGEGNPHFHVMLSLRPINENGTWGVKQRKEYILDDNGDKIYDPKTRQYKCRSIPSTDWNSRGKADEWRKAWEDIANAEFKRVGSSTRIDRRSYAEQGIDQIPTIHMGVAASQMERNGIRTERGNINREIAVTNQQIRQLQARITKVANWLKEESTNIEPPTLADIISGILARQGQSGVSKLKAASQMLLFLTDNKIYDTDDLEKKVGSMFGKLQSVRTDLKKVERRIDTLNEHFDQSAAFKSYRKHKVQYEKLYAQYDTLKTATGFGAKRKAEKALQAANEYHETYRSEIVMYEKAERYLKDVLQERFDPKKQPPVAKWREEYATKLAEKDALYREYYAVKEETAKVEQIRRGVTDILRSEAPGRSPKRAQGMEL